MRFEADAGCYTSIDEMNQARRDMLRERLPDIARLREVLFSFDVDTLYLAEEFVQRHKFSARRRLDLLPDDQGGP